MNKTGKSLNKFMIIAKYEETMENLRNRIGKTSKKRKRLFKIYIKTKLYVAQNIWQQFSHDT